MAHPRTEIRQAVVTLLTGATVAGARVYDTRVIPHKRTELPAIAVYTASEAVELSQEAPRRRRRVVALTIEAAVVTTATSAERQLDDLALEIEAALDLDETFTGTADDSLLESTETEVMEDGDRLIGLLTMSFRATKHTYIALAPAVDDFETANVRYNLASAVHVDNEAVDKIDMED